MGALSPLRHRPRFALTSLLGLLLTSAHASAQAEASSGNVALTRAAPFDQWCVAPLCQPVASTKSHPALFHPPAAVLPQSSDGLLEQRLKAQLIVALQEQARALDVWSKPVADLSRGAVAALAQDRDDFEHGLGLTGSVLRAGLVLEAEKVLPRHAECAGSRRLDAIYEGLALSVALAPLRFPEASRSTSQSCVETAKAAEKLVDEQALRALVPADLAKAAVATVAKVRAAEAACRPLLQQAPAEGQADAQVANSAKGLPEHATIADYAAYWATLQQLRSPELPQGAPACSAALGGPDSVSLPELTSLRDLGLEQAEAEQVATALDSAKVAQGAGELQKQLQALLRQGGLTQQALRDLLASIVRDFKPSALSDDVWSHLIGALSQAVVEDGTGHGSIDPALVVRALKDAYGLDEHGVPTLRTLLGFKPTPWIGEANAGIPRLRSDDFRIIGDARLGYQGKHFGVVGNGGIKNFDFVEQGVETQDAHYFGGADASLMLGDATDKVRFELRVAGLVDYVDTTILQYPNAAGDFSFADYDSTLIRASAKIGVRIAPNERVVLRLLAAGGYQYETHDTTNVSQDASLGNFESVDTGSARWGGSVLGAYRFLPGILGARLRGDLDYYRLTIDRLTFDFAGQPIVEQPQASQLELSGRLFLDVDVASFVGFVPAAFVGLDYLSRTGAGPAVAATTPSFGLGLMRRSD